MLAEGTHQLILKEYISRTNKPILELGAGDNSTRQIHEWCSNEIVTVDHDQKWLDKYLDLECERHKFLLLNDVSFYEYFIAYRGWSGWGLVFIDLINWELRKEAILKYKNADYLVIHDTEYMFREVFTRDEFSSLFKYWKEFTELVPNTTVASNKYEL